MMKFATHILSSIALLCQISVIEARHRPAPIRQDLLDKRQASAPKAQYTEYNATLDIDHFKNSSLYEPHSDDTFQNRYWFDDTVSLQSRHCFDPPSSAATWARARVGTQDVDTPLSTTSQAVLSFS